MLKKMSKGFTLIELIVVIAIIAVLAGLVIIRIGSASRDARNSRRSADMNQIRSAIEQYKSNGGSVTVLAAQDIPANVSAPNTLDNGAGKLFVGPDGKGNYPSNYLSGSVYPGGPQSGELYRITGLANNNYTITRDTFAPIPSDAPSAAEVPDVNS